MLHNFQFLAPPGSKILNEKSLPVKTKKEARRLKNKLFKCFNALPGAGGLAGPQINEPYAACILLDKHNEAIFVANPKVIQASEKKK